MDRRMMGLTVTKRLTHALDFARRGLRLAQQRRDHLRQQVLSFTLPFALLATADLQIPPHHLKRLGQRAERGAHVGGDGDGVRARPGLGGAG